MAVQIGPKIGIEGEKEYREQIQQIIQQAKSLDSAMNATSSAWDKNTSQMTKNKAEAQKLVQQIGLFQQKLNAMNSILEQSSEKYGENDRKTLAWKRAIDETTASINYMKQQLASFNGAESFSEISTKMADFGTKVQNIGANLTAVGQKMTMSLTVPLVAAGTAAVKLGSDLEESANKVDVVFGNMADTVKSFAETSTEAYAISKGKALEMAGDYGAMATSMGMTQQQAANLSTALVGLAGDMASFHNKNIEVAQTSLKGVFTGETEALKQFGVAMTQTNLEDFAAKQGKVYNQMSQSEKVLTRYQFLLESQKDAIGDAGRTMDGFAGSTRQLKAAFENAGAALGQALIPLVTPMIQAITKLMNVFANLPEPVQRFIAVAVLLVAAIGPVIVILGTLTSAIGSLITNIPLIIEGLSAVAAAFVGVDVAAAPVIGIIVALAAAIAVGAFAGYELAKNWDDICAKAAELGESIKSAYNNIMSKNDELRNNVHDFVSDVINFFKTLPDKIVQALKTAVTKAKDAFDEMIRNAKQSGQDFIQGFVDGIKEKVQSVIDTVKEIAETIEEYLGFSCPDKGPLSQYEKWMPDFMEGLARGIYENKGVVTKAINSLSKEMVLPLDTSASMNMAFSNSESGYASTGFGGTVMNISVDHISELNDLLRIQNQAQQRYRMGAR